MKLVTWSLGVAGIAFLLAGCSTSGPPMSSLSGKVTVDEAPVSGGKVTFEKGDERITAVIFSDGSYNVAHIPQGSWKVIVTEPGPASDPKEKRAPVSIPAKYRDAKTTDLTYTSKEGDQTFNIELKKK